MEFEVMAPDPERRVQVAIDDIRAGRMVILVDDEDRENEGDLTMAAEKVTPEAINFMATWGRGLICLTLSEQRVDQLQLPMMVSNNRAPFATAFTVSIEAREGVSTGISAADRARTIQVAIDGSKGAQDLVTPGHIFPLRSRDGGVLVRTGQTEGSVDLARLAGLHPSGVICEVMNDDGSMARLPDLEKFGARHKIHIVTIADLIRWRMRHEQLVTPVMDVTLPTEAFGEWQARVYRSTPGGLHMALWKGDLAGAPVLARVQASAGPVDVFRPLTSDSSDQIHAAMARIADEGRGVLLYLHIDGNEEALLSRLREHLGAAPAGAGDALRELGVGAQILAHLGACEIRLLTNNPRKIVGLEGYGVKVVERIPLRAEHTPDRAPFLAARSRIGHLLNRDPVG
jgi:3,4-dihydroxy 2-butanone 4-phosphate synthase/GTP cyclohydrolase II